MSGAAAAADVLSLCFKDVASLAGRWALDLMSGCVIRGGTHELKSSMIHSPPPAVELTSDPRQNRWTFAMYSKIFFPSLYYCCSKTKVTTTQFTGNKTLHCLYISSILLVAKTHFVIIYFGLGVCSGEQKWYLWDGCMANSCWTDSWTLLIWHKLNQEA